MAGTAGLSWTINTGRPPGGGIGGCPGKTEKRGKGCTLWIRAFFHFHFLETERKGWDLNMEKKKQTTTENQAEELLKMAASAGLEQNYFFTTTFDRYQTQIDILAKLKESIEAEGILIAKEYVKGRENLYTHPAIKEYNSTTNAANRTVSTLIDIIAKLRPDKGNSLNPPEDGWDFDFEL